MQFVKPWTAQLFAQGNFALKRLCAFNASAMPQQTPTPKTAFQDRLQSFVLLSSLVLNCACNSGFDCLQSCVQIHALIPRFGIAILTIAWSLSFLKLRTLFVHDCASFQICRTTKSSSMSMTRSSTTAARASRVLALMLQPFNSTYIVYLQSRSFALPASVYK